MSRHPIFLLFISPLLIATYFAVFGYPLLRISSLLGYLINPTVFYVLLTFPLMNSLICQIIHNPITRYLSIANRTYLGTLFISLCLLLIFEFINLWMPIESATTGLVILILTVTITLYAFIEGQKIGSHYINLTSKKLSKPIKLIQLTDVHIGSRSGKFLHKIIDHALTEHPDLFIITGDLIDVGALPEKELAAFKKITVPIYYCIGNHERYVDLDKILEKLAKLNFNILRNRSMVHDELQILGIDDADNKNTVAYGLEKLSIDATKYSVLLYHRPVGFEDAAKKDIDLMLSGHTHNGQIMPFHWLVKIFFPRITDLHQINQSYLYVSPGTSTWGPAMRLGSKNEVSVIQLLPENHLSA